MSHDDAVRIGREIKARRGAPLALALGRQIVANRDRPLRLAAPEGPEELTINPERVTLNVAALTIQMAPGAVAVAVEPRIVAEVESHPVINVHAPVANAAAWPPWDELRDGILDIVGALPSPVVESAPVVHVTAEATVERVEATLHMDPPKIPEMPPWREGMFQIINQVHPAPQPLVIGGPVLNAPSQPAVLEIPAGFIEGLAGLVKELRVVAEVNLPATKRQVTMTGPGGTWRGDLEGGGA